VVVVAARLTDGQEKRIQAYRAEGRSLRSIAAEFGVAASTVKRVCDRNPEIEQIATQKKEQNTLDMLAFMDSRREKAQAVIDIYLNELAKPEKLNRAGVQQIATALGIVVDKFSTESEKNDGEGVRVIIDV